MRVAVGLADTLGLGKTGSRCGACGRHSGLQETASGAIHQMPPLSTELGPLLQSTSCGDRLERAFLDGRNRSGRCQEFDKALGGRRVH